MKPLYILTLFLLLAQLGSAQTAIPKHEHEKFLNDLKDQMLSDTLKYDRSDLIHHSFGTQNQNSYSKLFIINKKYSYKLDIISPDSVKEFVHEFLNLKRVKNVFIVEPPSSIALYGSYGNNGVVLIEVKGKFNPEVAGLKLKQNGGNNFDQRKVGEFIIRGHAPKVSQASKRVIRGIILSDQDEPIPGVTISEIGKYDIVTTSNLDGEFTLEVEDKDIVFIELSGMHFDRYLKYEPDEDFKRIVFQYKGSKKAERKSKRVFQQWKLKSDENR